MPEVPCPAESELAILHVLWDREPRSVREVHEVISATKPVGYTTVLKTMQIMTDKGLVKRDERRKAHLYRSALPAPRVKKRLVDDLVERVFGGAADQLVMHALSGRKASAKELTRLRHLLATLEAKLWPTPHESPPDAALIDDEDVERPLIETLELIPEPDGSPTEDFVIPEGFKHR